MQRRRAIVLPLWFAGIALYALYPIHNRTAILTTMGHDLANHVRHVYEAGLALREGQIPPLVCPALDGGTRLPLFQYYSGTSYWIPAVWSLIDSNPYRALKIGIFFHVFVAGASVYGVVRMMAGRGEEGDERQDGKTPRKNAKQYKDRNERRDAETQRRVDGLSLNSSVFSDLGVSASRRSSPFLRVVSLASWRLGVHFSPASSAALIAAIAYQVAPFSAADLYSRGSYTEFAALHAAPAVLYCALRLVRSITRRESVAWICVCGLATAYFIPLHPVQTLLCGALIAVLAAADALVDRRAGWRGLVKLAAAAVLGLAGSAWFWAPVARDYDSLRIVPHGAFLDAGLADPIVLFWPTFREAASYPWAPQIGLHFAVAAVLVLVWKQRRAVGIAAAITLLLIIFVVLFHEKMPPVQRLLRPLQWSYRLLVPATLAGAVCVGLAMTSVLARVGAGRAREAVVGIALMYVLGTSTPYFLGYEQGPRRARVRNVLAPTWQAPNSTGSYALRGTDYRLMKFVRDDGTLNVDTDIAIPPEGVATAVGIVLRRSGDGATDASGAPGAAAAPEVGAVRVGVGAGPNGLRSEGGAEWDGPSRLRLTFQIRPRVGHVAGDAVVRFTVSPPAVNWSVEDVTFRAAADDEEILCRVPLSVVRKQEGCETRLDVHVATGREGMYQLPVFVLPSNEVTVNGEPAPATQSANRAMVIVPLRPGANVVKIRTRHSPGAWEVSAFAVLSMGAGLSMAAMSARRRGHAAAELLE